MSVSGVAVATSSNRVTTQQSSRASKDRLLRAGSGQHRLDVSGEWIVSLSKLDYGTAPLRLRHVGWFRHRSSSAVGAHAIALTVGGCVVGHIG